MPDTREWTAWSFASQAGGKEKLWIYYRDPHAPSIELDERRPGSVITSAYPVCCLPWRAGDTAQSLPPIPERFL